MDTISTPTVQRLRPTGRHVEIPERHRGLVVQGGRPRRTVPPGRQRVRGLWEPRPELYLYPEDPFPLFLHLDGLHSAEGTPLHLSWKLRVRIEDPIAYWRQWLNLQEGERIPGPDGLIAARVADPVQQAIAQHTLEDLRTDPEVRGRVGMAILRRAQQEMRSLGLTVAEEPDPQRMRVYTEQEQMAAEQERALLAHMQADERLQRTIQRLETVNTLAHYLTQWLQDHGFQPEPNTVFRLAEAILQGREAPSAQELQKMAAAPPHAPDMSPSVTLRASDELLDREHGQGFAHLRYHIGQLILMAGTLAALALAGVLVFRPEMLWDNRQPHLMIGLVTAIALGGVLIAWSVDRLIHRQARQAAQRTLGQIGSDPLESTGRMEMRHTLTLLAAFLAVAAAGVALWLPNYYPWLRFGGAVVTLVAAALAVRYDWLQTMEHAAETVAQAQRRVARVHLDAATRARQHRRLQASLAAEIRAALDHLDKARGKAFRDLRNRPLYARLHQIREELSTLIPAIQALEQASLDYLSQEPDTVAQRIQAMREEIGRCSDLAQAIFWHVQQAQVDAATQRLDELELSVQEMQALLARWQAVTV